MTQLKKYQVRKFNGIKSSTHVQTFDNQKEAEKYINKQANNHNLFVNAVAKVINPYRKLRKVS